MHDPNYEKPSKSQNKRDAEALQKLGAQLIDLDHTQLEVFPLSSGLQRAIQDAKHIKSHGALRRQIQYIGKLMRGEDHEAIKLTLYALKTQDAKQISHFHKAELWRDKLSAEGTNALTEFIELFQPVDIQLLRQQIKKVTTASTEEQQKNARKALFRFIKPYIDAR